jgi:hypothetical protein
MPDTQDYMLMGYALGLLIMAITVGSIYWRYRSIQADQQTLQQLESESQSPAPAAANKTVQA